MADAETYIKDPNEAMKDFNLRLKEACVEIAPTDFQLVCVDGEPAVTLLAAMVEATEEDVEESKLAHKEDKTIEVLEVGEPIPESEPLVVQVAKLLALEPTVVDESSGHISKLGDAPKSERRLDTLYKRADGNIIKHVHAAGKSHRFIKTPDGKNQIWAEITTNYMAVAYSATEPPENNESEEGESE